MGHTLQFGGTTENGQCSCAVNVHDPETGPALHIQKDAPLFKDIHSITRLTPIESVKVRLYCDYVSTLYKVVRLKYSLSFINVIYNCPTFCGEIIKNIINLNFDCCY